ncbi:MAG: hypothetical protein KGK07_01875 [Chloroflexota bacterium]|nr:hypothetical protein [Chloroflexota bacterium]
MSESLEQLFLARLDDMHAIRRQGVAAVCEDSTPVLFFGELSNARTITIGINPSWHEFWGKDHKPLPPTKRRFAHQSDFCGDDASNARVALDGMRRYFQSNPYRAWFGWLEALLNGFGDSYYAGTAAHTDVMSCFATSPAWSKLGEAVSIRLAASGYETLAAVLLYARHAERIIVVGKTAREALEKQAGFLFLPVSTELDHLPKMKGWTPALRQSTWRLPDGRALPLFGLKPYLRGTPGAPLSHAELRSVAALLEDRRMRRAS